MKLKNEDFVYLAEGNALFLQDLTSMDCLQIGFFIIRENIMMLEFFPRAILLPVPSVDVMRAITGDNQIKRISIGPILTAPALPCNER